MSSKLTELNEYSPSAPSPSVLCGSGIFSQLYSPSMASSGHFDPSQTYDGYQEVEILDPACTECLAKVKDCFQHYNPRSSKCHYCFIGKKPCPRTGVLSFNVRRQRDVARWTSVGGPIPVGGRPIYSSSEVPISRTNTEGVVKVDGEEVKVLPHSVGHPSSNSSTQPLANRVQSQVIPSNPRTFQPILASISTTIPPPSPSTSHSRPALNPEVRPSPVQKSRNSPITTSHQLQPVASSSRRRDGLSPLPFPATQVSQRRDFWPIRVTREDPNASSENQEAVARLFRRVDRNSR
ncbi:hypothetical protein O181_101897 [Austropuccinia psidii MF-1]|uniref:Uncharacterized protein n=1 Tax=Austropuccinia psidii MF-1 TaxID=1389203 RepID=A0A9Q3JGW2_9BASI|nr:hypothetical protein [Austropuccinia psidii MF-1]